MEYSLSIEDDFVLVNPPLNYKIESYRDNYINDNNPSEIILPFNTKDLINSISYSYKTNKEIFDQFKIDMRRTRIYYNNKNSIIHHFKLYDCLLNNTHLKYKVIDILLCLTQSVFYWPYKMIYHKYCTNNSSNIILHLGEISTPKNSKSANLKVVNNNHITFMDNNDSQIIIYKKLRIFKIDSRGNDQTLKILTIELHISLTDTISLLKIY